MKNHHNRRTYKGFLAVAGVLAVSLGLGLPTARAAGTTKVVGTVKTPDGKPVVGIKIRFEHGKIAGKTAKPVKVNKKGKFSMPFLDIGSGPEWRVIPESPDYMTLRVQYISVDSQGVTRDEGDRFLDENQDFPVIRFFPIGQGVVVAGRNEVNFTVVPKAQFARTLSELQEKQAEGKLSEEQLAAQREAEEKRKKQEEGFKAFDEGVSLANQGRHEDAVESLMTYVEIEPEDEAGHYQLAKSLEELERFDDAEREYRRTLELNPDHPGAHFHLGVLFARQERYPEAQAQFEEELERTPDDPTVMFNLALVISEQGKIADSITWFEKVAAVQPDNAEVYWKLAKLFEEQGDQEKANLQYEKFARANPEEADVAFYNIGSEAFNERRREEAAVAFRKALEVNPNHADAHRQLGYCLVGMGEFESAVQHFRKFLELKPDSPYAREISETISQLTQ